MSADNHKKQGDAFCSKQQWHEAVDAYKSAITLQPNNSVLYRLLAAAQVKTGDIEAAIVNYRKAIKLKPEDNFWGHRNLGDLLFNQKRWSEAIDNYEQAIDLQPTNSFTLRQLAIARENLGDIEGAITNYHRAIESNPQFFRNYKDLGELLCRQKRWGEAIAIYQKAVSLQQDNYWAKAELGLTLIKAGRNQKAIVALEKLEKEVILNKYPQKLQDNIQFIKLAYTALFKLRLELGNKHLESAICNYEKAVVQLNQENRIAYSLLGYGLENNNNKVVKENLLVKALPFYQKAATIENQQQLDTITKNFLELKKSQKNDRNPLNKKFLFAINSVASKATDGPLQVILDYAISIAENITNSSICILITNELFLLFDPEVKISKLYDILHQRISFFSKNPQLVKGKIEIYCLNPHCSNYWNNLLTKVIEINPFVVVSFGGLINGNQVSSAFFYQLYPTIYMQLNNGDRPVGNYDIYLSCGKLKNHSEFINPERWRHHSTIYLPSSKKKEGTANVVKSSTNAVVLVTVTLKMNERLVDNSIITNVAKIIKKYPEVCWVLVGATDREELLSRDEEFRILALQDRVKIISYEEDLRSLYEQCDIYIHHRSSGGGYGMALAVCESLPVLVYEESDACNFLDESVIFSNNEDYFRFLEKLICNPELRKSIGIKLKAMMDMRSGETAVKEFLGFCEEARANFFKRKSIDNLSKAPKTEVSGAVTAINFNSYRNLGDLLSKESQWEEAINAYENAIKLQPNNSVLYRLLAASQASTGAIEVAIANYEKAIKLKPEGFWGYRNLGDLLLSQQRWSEAINNYEKAVELQPDNSFTYRQLAIAQEKTGDVEGAILNYSKARETNPEFFGNYKNLGDVLCQQKRWNEAILNYQKAVALQPDNYLAKAALGMTKLKAGFEDRRVQNKVFCIGFHKTGTSTFTKCLVDWGYVISTFWDFEKEILALKNYDLDRVKSVMTDIYAKRFYSEIIKFCQESGIHAFQDLPYFAPDLFIALDRTFPKSKFILSVRDENDWYDSLYRHTTLQCKRHNFERPTWEAISYLGPYEGYINDVLRFLYGVDESSLWQKDKYIEVYLKHNQTVQDYFKNRKEDLIVINVSNNNDYFRLCDFLSQKPLYEKFPHINKSQ